MKNFGIINSWYYILSNCLLNIYTYAHRQGLLLALIRETHCSTEQWWTFKIYVCTRYWNVIADDCLALNQAFISYPLHCKAQRILWNRNWKENKSWKIGIRVVKCIFLSRHVLCNPKFTADCIGSAQKQSPSTDGHGVRRNKTIKPSLLNNYLLLIDSGRMECCLSLCIHWRLHQVPMGRSNPVLTKMAPFKLNGTWNKNYNWGRES